MNYAAINAKLRAMGANLPVLPGREAIIQSAANICRYIPGKLQKDYVMAMAATQKGNINYYMAQWKRLNRLDRPNRTVLRGLMGAEIDLNNILWMYRLKRYHRITGDGTFGYLIPIRYRLSRETTRRMADCITPKALTDEITNSPYSTDFKYLAASGAEAKSDALTPEEILAEAIMRRYQTVARCYPNSLVPTLAYIKKLTAQPAAVNADN